MYRTLVLDRILLQILDLYDNVNQRSDTLILSYFSFFCHYKFLFDYKVLKTPNI